VLALVLDIAEALLEEEQADLGNRLTPLKAKK